MNKIRSKKRSRAIKVTLKLQQYLIIEKLAVNIKQIEATLDEIGASDQNNTPSALKTDSPKLDAFKRSFDIISYNELRKRQDFTDKLNSSNRYDLIFDLTNFSDSNDTFKLTKSNDKIIRYLSDDFVKLINEDNNNSNND